MSLTNHAGSVRDRIVIVVVLAALGGAAGYMAALNQAAQYQSSALIALGAKQMADSSLSSATQALFDRSVPSTLAQMAGSSSVVTAASLTTGVAEGDYEVKGVVANDANVVEIIVTGVSPEGTQALAMEAAAVSMMNFNQLYPLFRTINIGTAAPGVDTRVSPLIGAAAGALAGAFLGILLSLAWGRRQPALNVVERSQARAAG